MEQDKIFVNYLNTLWSSSKQFTRTSNTILLTSISNKYIQKFKKMIIEKYNFIKNISNFNYINKLEKKTRLAKNELSNYDFNTVWMDAQEFINETINFGYLSSNTNRGINPGLLPFPFNTSNAIYENSSSNRNLVIPPNVGTEDFYLLVNIGFYYKSSAAFRYIQPIFN